MSTPDFSQPDIDLTAAEVEEIAEANLRTNVRTLSRISGMKFEAFAKELGFSKSGLGSRLVHESAKKPTKFSAAELVRISTYSKVDPAALLSDEPRFLAALGEARSTPPGTRTQNLMLHGNSHSPSNSEVA